MNVCFLSRSPLSITKKSSSSSSSTEPLKVKARVWLEKNGEPVLGGGRALLLEAVSRHGSLNKAATELGYSYRHAWGILRKMNEALGEDVTRSTAGGKSGGKTELTPAGKALLGLYKEKQDAVNQTLSE